MHYFAHLELRQFYSSHVGGSESPCLVVHKHHVFCANRPAVLAGVQPGMRITEAQSIVPQALVKDYCAEDYAAASQEWLRLVLDFSGSIQVLAPHMCCIDLYRQVDVQELASHMVHRLGVELNLSAVCAVSPTRWIAKVAAQQLMSIEPVLTFFHAPLIDSPDKFSQVLPVETLPLPTEIVGKLGLLGIRTCEDLRKMPTSMLRAHFGKVGDTLKLYAHGHNVDTFCPNFPEDSLYERLALEGGSSDRQVVQSGLDALADRLHHQLLTMDSECRQLTLRVHFEDFSIQSAQRAFIKPLRKIASLRLGLNCLLDEITLQRPIYHLSVFAEGLSRGGQAQSAFSTLLSENEKKLRAQKAMTHVRAVFGETAVMPANDLQVPRRNQVLRAWMHALGWR